MSEKRTTTGVDEVACLETADDLVEVDLVLGRLVRAHDDVTGIVDAEVTVAPGLDAVELERILDVPAGAGDGFARGVVQFQWPAAERKIRAHHNRCSPPL